MSRYGCRSATRTIFRDGLVASQVEKLTNILQAEDWYVIVEEEGEPTEAGDAPRPRTYTLRATIEVCACPERRQLPSTPPTPSA